MTSNRSERDRKVEKAQNFETEKKLWDAQSKNHQRNTNYKKATRYQLYQKLKTAKQPARATVVQHESWVDRPEKVEAR